jgi:uncharacterized protein (UPF0303 family)
MGDLLISFAESGIRNTMGYLPSLMRNGVMLDEYSRFGGEFTVITRTVVNGPYGSVCSTLLSREHDQIVLVFTWWNHWGFNPSDLTLDTS